MAKTITTPIKLTKGIYGYETDRTKTPFGLLNGQVLADGIIDNAGWFNSNGEKLGYGDLSLESLRDIQKTIPKDEAFFVLSEYNTMWAIPKELDQTAPGKNYVVENCSWVVCADIVIRVAAVKTSIGKLDAKLPYVETNRKTLDETMKKWFANKERDLERKRHILDIAPSDGLTDVSATLQKLSAQLQQTQPARVATISGGSKTPTTIGSPQNANNAPVNNAVAPANPPTQAFPATGQQGQSLPTPTNNAAPISTSPFPSIAPAPKKKKKKSAKLDPSLLPF
jgi:hypothetical protein